MTMRWVYTVILLIVPIITAYINSIVQMMMVKLGVQMKSIAQEAVYQKALRLTSTSKGSTSTRSIGQHYVNRYKRVAPVHLDYYILMIMIL